MNPAKRVEKLRTEYERALSASEARGAAYHQALLGLLDGGGPELRGLAAELGLLDRPADVVQPAEQTLTRSRPRRRHSRARAAGGLAAVLVLAALTLAALRLVQAPPFVPMVRVPRVMGLREAVAIRRLEDAGLRARLVRYRRSIPGVPPNSIVGVSHAAGTPAAGEYLAKGSPVTLYVVVPPGRATKPKAHS